MLIRGSIRGTRQGFAFLSPEGGGEDLFVAEGNLNGAIHGDRVEATIHRRSPYDFRPEGVVERIVERPDPIFTGNVVRLARTVFVVPDIPVLPARIRMKTGGRSVSQGTKVLFRIEDPRAGVPPVATLERPLGDADDPALDAVVIATAHHLPGRFPDEVLDEAVEAAAHPDREDEVPRTDYTDRLVLTIDPKDAKDFDDAISLERDRSGYHLQVHIADASAFVREGGAVDAEAARRGNSIYFPGGVIPMLPEILSSHTASLAPGEIRRVLTAEIDLDIEGEVQATRFREGFIRSAARLHYEQAQRMLTEEEGDHAVRSSLREMAEVARTLRRNRFRDGGFDLELPETEMKLDGQGVPVRIWRHRTLDSHRLIEEFMILANRAVGRFVVEQGMPLLFRVHGEPDPVALERFAEVAMTLVPGTKARDLETMPALRRFLARLPREPIGRIVHFFFLRSMKKAVYSPIDLGHFGLGIDRYCHFTSPIRRYPDLFNHRIVRWLIRNGSRDRADSGEGRRWDGRALALAPACTGTEQTAEKAEREMIRLKTLRWAERRLGETFRGRVVGLTGSGLFVEFDRVPVEGFLPREGLSPGVRYESERLAFVDRRSRFELRIGDPIEVQIVRVDLRERQLDLQWVRHSGGKKAGRKGPLRRRERRSAGSQESNRGSRPIRVKPVAVRADRGKGRKRPRKTKRAHPRRGGGR